MIFCTEYINIGLILFSRTVHEFYNWLNPVCRFLLIISRKCHRILLEKSTFPRNVSEISLNLAKFLHFVPNVDYLVVVILKVNFPTKPHQHISKFNEILPEYYPIFVNSCAAVHYLNKCLKPHRNALIHSGTKMIL